jgi:protein-tyrosine phosphatase
VRLLQRNEDIYDSYINANYINSSCARNDQQFIATQGPLQSTTENFWRMIDQEQVQLIVMLTACKEHGKTKCDLYWPCEVGDSLDYDEGSLTVNLVSVESLMPNLIKRKLLV